MTSSAEPAKTFLDPVTLRNLVRITLDALPHHPDATAQEIADQREAALIMVETLGPRDPIEAGLAARSVGLHFAAMDALRCAAQPDVPLTAKLRCQSLATKLMQLADASRQTLLELQIFPARERKIPPLAMPQPRQQKQELQAKAPVAPAPAAASSAEPKQPMQREPAAPMAPGPRPAVLPAAAPQAPGGNRADPLPLAA